MRKHILLEMLELLDKKPGFKKEFHLQIHIINYTKINLNLIYVVERTYIDILDILIF